jgi:DNA uptake protein ComE-like DNA-binding protein
MSLRQPNSAYRRRLLRKPGVVLILVLVVVVMLSLGAYTYATLMRSHRTSALLTSRQLQAKLMVDSGVDYVRIYLSQPADAQAQAGGKYNNPQAFQQLPILYSEDPNERGYVTVVAPALDDDGNLAGIRFGLEDESARLNLNTLLTAEKQQAGSGRQLLMALPSMTEDVADAILDWIDTDDEPRELGAESEYYTALEPPYRPKNGPLDTVEELLRVKGITPQLLFGSDVNRNGQIDPNEAAGPPAAGGSSFASSGSGTASLSSAATSTTTTDSTGSLDRGWSAYLTLHSMERNLNPEGQPRIHLNQSDLTQLYTELSEVLPADWATFIVAYRQGAPSTGGDEAQPVAGKALDLSLPAKRKFVQVLDLIDATVQVKFQGDEQASNVKSPFSSDLGAAVAYMPQLMDHVTVNPTVAIPGRININQAPACLLRGIPGISEEIIERILSSRGAETSEEQPNRRHETWLLAEGVVSLTEMKLLQPFINAGGHVYRAQVVGYFQSGEAAARVEAIFDATGSLPRVVLWRDMSHLGRGYALETLGVDYSEMAQ